MRNILVFLLAFGLAAIGCFAAEPAQFESVLVEGGTFTMGTNDYPTSTEGPAHRVSVPSFWIGKTEIVRGLFAQFVKETGYKTDCERNGKGSYVFDNGHAFIQYKEMNWAHPRFSQEDNHPVTAISWFDSVLFANWLSKKEGLNEAYTIVGKTVTWNRESNGWRLPTEAEWEFAARGGNKSQNTLYAGSNNLEEVAWYDENSHFLTFPVGSKKPNELGLYDMTGNVYEWCWDWYASYTSDPQENPAGSTTGLFRSYRGGSWYSGPWVNEELRNTTRSFAEPHSTYNYNGIRLVRNK